MWIDKDDKDSSSVFADILANLDLKNLAVVFDDDDVLDKIPQGIAAAVFEFLYTLKEGRKNVERKSTI
jgi:hypothetical protein